MAQQLPLIEAPTAVDTTGVPATPAPRVDRRRPRPTRVARAFAAAVERPGVLVEIAPADWHIDQHTKEVGLAGVAAARRALAAATGRQPERHASRTAA